MKVLKIALALAIAAISSFTAHAKNDPTTAYMFGFASSFNDSTVYMTSVQRVDSVYLTHKKLFLDNRENYSLQLKEYLESRSANMYPNQAIRGMMWSKRWPYIPRSFSHPHVPRLHTCNCPYFRADSPPESPEPPVGRNNPALYPQAYGQKPHV